jgi:hypothetical protein
MDGELVADLQLDVLWSGNLYASAIKQVLEIRDLFLA